jgi:flagellar biosynthesis/type III secretory pathway M-ring protein FliF/YscJ
MSQNNNIDKNAKQHIQDNDKNVNIDSPPIMKSWNRLYTLVMANLVFWLLTFYIIRRIFE